MELLWQIVGFGAMVTIIASFQIKDSKRFVITQAVAQTLFVIHYFMIGSPSGAIQNLIAVIRAMMLMSNNKYLTSKAAKYAVMAAFLLSPLLVYERVWDLLPGVAMLINTYYVWSMNSKMMRLSQAAIVSPLWIAYNLINLSLPGVFTELFNATSSVVFLVRMKKERQNSVKGDEK